MKKRGLSDVVTTLLIILLAFASVSIIWIVAKAFIFESTSQIDLGQFTSTFSISGENVQLNKEIQLVSFNVRRDSGEGAVAKINFILKDERGMSKAYAFDYKNEKFNAFETKKIDISYLGSGLEKLSAISIAPSFFNQDGKEITGSSSLAYKFTGSEKTAGMTLWLDFENGFVDKSGWENAGTPVGGLSNPAADSAPPTPVRASKVEIFDGSAKYLSVEDSPSLNVGTGSFSISFWMGGMNLPNAAVTRILDKSVTNPAVKGYYVWLTQQSSTYKIRMYIVEGTKSAYGEWNVPDTSWHLYTLVVNRTSNTMQLFIDDNGNARTIVTAPINMQDVGSLDNNAKLFIGANGGGGSYYNGKLDNIMLFNRALTSNEIAKIYAL